MLRRSAIPALFALAMLACGTLQAGFQVRRSVGSLTVDGGHVVVRDGIAGIAREPGTTWSLGAPTISAQGDLFLARSEKDGDVRLVLAREKGAEAEWNFELVRRIEPGRAGRSEGLSNSHLLVGPAGETFYLIVASGPRKGWYVTPEPPQTQSPATDPTPRDFRRLTLVEHRSRAQPFTFVRTVYSIGHK